jgi:aspartate aminotransferase
VKLAHGRPVFVPLREERGFQPDVDEVRTALSPRTRMIVVNSPSNPTGTVFSRETLARIADLACEKRLTVVSDEIYERIVFDGCRHVSIAALGPQIAARTATVNGVSKAYAMTGWRIGYAALPPELAEKATRLQSLSTSGPCAVSQRAALEALTGDQGSVAMMAAEYQKRRDFVVQRISGIPGLSCLPPMGAFYAFVNIGGWIGRCRAGVSIDGSKAFADLLLRAARIKLQPGTGFGSDSHVRISFATSLESLREGLDRIASLLEKGGP